MFVTASAGSVELGRTACQLISQKEIPQRESFQLGTQVGKLVCRSHLREEFLGGRWIELRDTCLSQNLRPVSNEILWKRSIQAVSKREVQAISSSQRRVHAWRQESARREIDKADSWFSQGYCPDCNEMLWKRNVHAVRMGEVQAISPTSEVCMLCRPTSASHLSRRGMPELHSNGTRTLAIAVLNSIHVSTVLTLPKRFSKLSQDEAKGC